MKQDVKSKYVQTADNKITNRNVGECHRRMSSENVIENYNDVTEKREVKKKSDEKATQTARIFRRVFTTATLDNITKATKSTK